MFVASPSDVQSERDLLESVVDEINELAETTGHILRLVRWEKDVRPGVADDPQEVVNRQAHAADITIVVFWKRLGTPTNRASSRSSSVPLPRRSSIRDARYSPISRRH